MKPRAARFFIFIFWTLISMSASSATINIDSSCPYNSVQIRVQEDTQHPWSKYISVPMSAIHIGAFKNGWGVPIDAGTVSVHAANGSMSFPLQLNVWETWWVPPLSGAWTFSVYCGPHSDSANAHWFNDIDVLSYVYPKDSSGNDLDFTVDTKANGAAGNHWRTHSDYYGEESLPGFFITKGGTDYNTGEAYNFEHMIYDSEWIYLVRDTSWDRRCHDNGHLVGQLLFRNEGGWKRGGPHFPRFIPNNQSRKTGSKYVQAVERKQNAGDTQAIEGRWCDADNTGRTSSEIKAQIIPSITIGGRKFHDVLKLSVVGGSGTDDGWWFAKNFGLVRFSDANLTEEYSKTTQGFLLEIRMPCSPGPHCM